MEVTQGVGRTHMMTHTKRGQRGQKNNKTFCGKKCLSVLRGVNGLPSSTLKVFFLRLNVLLFFLNDHENYILYHLNKIDTTFF